MMKNIFKKKHFKKLIFQKKHLKKFIALYFSFEQKLVHVFLLSCQRQWKNASVKENFMICSTLGDMPYFNYTKN